MAALNQPDSAYCAPPPGAPLAARHEKLRLSIHFYRSCFSISFSLFHALGRLTFLLEFRTFLFFYLSSPSLSRFLTLPPLFNNRSLFHRAPYKATVSIRVSPRYQSRSLFWHRFFLYLFPLSLSSRNKLLAYCIPSSTMFQTKNKFDNCIKQQRGLLHDNPFIIIYTSTYLPKNLKRTYNTRGTININTYRIII